MTSTWCSVSSADTRAAYAVGARCVCGRPLAVITRPVLPGGIPFPTTCYLTGPEAVGAASHVEAAGVMQQYNDMLALDEELKAAYEQAHNCIWHSATNWQDVLATVRSILKALRPAACRCASSACMPCFGPVLGYGAGRQPHWRRYWNASKTNRSDRLPLQLGRLIIQMSQREQSIHTH